MKSNLATVITRRLASSRKALAAVVAACCIVLGAAASPAVAATSRPADTNPLSQLTFTSVSNGYSLDDQNGTAGTGSIIVTDTTPGYDENWHLGDIASDDSFAIVNNTTGLCIDAGLPLRQQNCDGRSTENWYFQPIAGSSSAYMIRQEGSDNCLDLWFSAPYSDAWTDSYGCNGSAAQQWTLPAAAYQPAWSMAVQHAGAVCDSNTSTCTCPVRTSLGSPDSSLRTVRMLTSDRSANCSCVNSACLRRLCRSRPNRLVTSQTPPGTWRISSKSTVSVLTGHIWPVPGLARGPAGKPGWNEGGRGPDPAADRWKGGRDDAPVPVLVPRMPLPHAVAQRVRRGRPSMAALRPAASGQHSRRPGGVPDVACP